MAEAALLNIGDKILGCLGELAAEKVISWWGVDDDLNQLKDTITFINAVLVNADKGEADAVSKEWLRRLSKVFYRADDLFDEVFTVKHQTSHSLKQGNRLKQLGKKVILPFSKSGPICFNYHVAQEIKSIRKQLDAIRGDKDLIPSNLGANLRGEPSSKWETFSLVNRVIIVGREGEKNEIIEMLLSEPKPNEGSISVIPIVGMGGIGKTTLAQLVFNDDRVNNHFDITKWVWLSEKDNKIDIIRKIFGAFTDRDFRGLSLEHLQSSIRSSIHDQKYLLVLDNVWDESGESWLDVMNFLSCSQSGSRIVVTTRSSIVARNVGTFQNPYQMQLLSDDESWDLFQKIALPRNNPNKIAIGKEIVRKCGNVPLVIRAIGSVLCGKDAEIEWTRFKDSQLARIEQNGATDVISLLKLSYDHLPSELKQCFACFALIHKHNPFSRNHVIFWWMSLGFIKQSRGDYNLDLEDVGEGYFRELLSRNFFQDAIPTESGDILFRVHDLMRDLAAHVIDDHEELVVNPSFRINEVNEKLNGEVRYLSLRFDSCDSWEAPTSFPNARQIRSLRFENGNPSAQVQIHRLENMFSTFTSLRSLEFRGLMIECVPDVIGKLRHLRLLFVRSCPIKCLPSSIKSLWNLQNMLLIDCRVLKALPVGLSRLSNLRCLLLTGCGTQMELPPNFGKLKSLQRLSHFMVSKNNGLDALADMKLRGNLEIRHQIWRKEAIIEARKANFKEKNLLERLSLQLGHLENIAHDAVSLLDEFQPPPSLKQLEIEGYQGERLPSWMVDGLAIKLPKLVKLTLRSFKSCHFLSSGFYQLPLLKNLILSNLPELRGWSRVSSEKEEHCFDDVRRRDGEDGSVRITFPCLEKLQIYKCPKLISMPHAPILQELIVEDINVSMLAGEEASSRFSCVREFNSASVHGLQSLVVNGMPLLKKLQISREQLTSITVESSTSIKNLVIRKCERLREIQGLYHLSSCLENLVLFECKEMNELPKSMDRLMSLMLLVICRLPKLTALPGSMGQLISLRVLMIAECPELRSLPDSFNSMTQLRCLTIEYCQKMSSYIESSSFSDLLHSFTLLEKLLLSGLPDLKALPVSIQHIPHLRELSIVRLPEIRELPNWLTNLTSLHTLEIVKCPQLEERCKKPDGQDWPLIRHIPNLSFNLDFSSSRSYFNM